VYPSPAAFAPPGPVGYPNRVAAAQFGFNSGPPPVQNGFGSQPRSNQGPVPYQQPYYVPPFVSAQQAYQYHPPPHQPAPSHRDLYAGLQAIDLNGQPGYGNAAGYGRVSGPGYGSATNEFGSGGYVGYGVGVGAGAGAGAGVAMGGGFGQGYAPPQDGQWPHGPQYQGF